MQLPPDTTTLAERQAVCSALDAKLIAEGYPADCVKWICEYHHRHCTYLGTDHEEHMCVFDVSREEAEQLDEWGAHGDAKYKAALAAAQVPHYKTLDDRNPTMPSNDADPTE